MISETWIVGLRSLTAEVMWSFQRTIMNSLGYRAFVSSSGFDSGFHLYVVNAQVSVRFVEPLHRPL